MAFLQEGYDAVLRVCCIGRASRLHGESDTDGTG